jgi:hypothetical protein
MEDGAIEDELVPEGPPPPHAETHIIKTIQTKRIEQAISPCLKFSAR